jgi:hypothetical protein
MVKATLFTILLGVIFSFSLISQVQVISINPAQTEKSKLAEKNIIPHRRNQASSNQPSGILYHQAPVLFLIYG